jgi:ribose 5-phosphate isomerase B
MKIFIASDHAGFELKKKIIQSFPSFEWVDLGPNNPDRVDYPDFADKVSKLVNKGEGRGVLICGSGQGMAMRANKYPLVRAALCWSVEVTRLARHHNDANIICLGERVTPYDLAVEMVKVFFATDFEGGRHADRVKKISRRSWLSRLGF